MSKRNSVKSAYLTYYQRSWGVILSRATNYYENHKERLREQTIDKYRHLSEEEKIKRENIVGIDIAICLKKRNKY